MIKRRRPEQQIHRAVCQHLHARGVPGLVWFHPANGGQRNKIEAAILKGMGVRAGVSDLILLHKGTFHALELKATKGRLSDSQRDFIAAVLAAGGKADHQAGVDAALHCLQDWGLLRGIAA